MRNITFFLIGLLVATLLTVPFAHAQTYNYYGTEYCIGAVVRTTTATSGCSSASWIADNQYTVVFGCSYGDTENCVVERQLGPQGTCSDGYGRLTSIYHNAYNLSQMDITETPCGCTAVFSWVPAGGTSTPESEFDGQACKETACSNQYVSYDSCSLTTHPDYADFYNGVQDGDEEGIDCGGSSGVECVNACPSGTHLVGTGCYHATDPDQYGNCPDGYSSGSVDGVTVECSKRIDTVALASPAWLNDNPPEPFTGGSYFEQGTYSEVSSSTSETVDNGDGTSTTTTTTTTTNSDGTESTTTTSTTSNNSTGVVIGSTTTTTGTTSPEENLENYTGGYSEVGEFEDMTDLSDLAPDQESWEDWLADQVSSNSIVSDIQSISVQTTNSQCSISGVVLGTELVFSMCGEPYQSTLDTMGYILIFLSGIAAYMIVVVRG
jgi:hypothetical protein